MCGPPSHSTLRTPGAAAARDDPGRLRWLLQPEGEKERRRVGPKVGPTPALPTGMHAPTRIFWANLTPFSLEAAAGDHPQPAARRRQETLENGRELAALSVSQRAGGGAAGASVWSAKCLNWSIVTRAHVPRQVCCRRRRLTIVLDRAERLREVQLGLGRMVGLYYHSSTR